MNASIIARLGLDTAGYKKALIDAAAAAKSAGKSIVGGLALEKENKAERNIVGMTNELLRANSAGDVLVGTLGRLPDIFQSSLLAGAVGGIGTAIISGGMAAQKAFEQTMKAAKGLNAELRETIRFGNIGQLDAQAAGLPKQIDEYKAQLKELGSLKDIVFGAGSALLGGDSLLEKRQSLFTQIVSMERMQASLGLVRIAREEDLLEIAQLRADGFTVEAENKERLIKQEEQLLALTKAHGEKTMERLKPIVEARFAIQQTVEEKEKQKKLEAECLEFEEQEAQAIEKQAQARGTLGEMMLREQKRAEEMRAGRVAAEQDLARITETAQEKHNRLLAEFAALQGAAYAAGMLAMPEANKLREMAIRKQIELTQQAIEVNKEAGAQEKLTAEAKLTTAIMAAEVKGNSEVAKFLKTQADYEERILAARRDKNIELANELTKQKEISLEAQKQAIQNKAKFTLDELQDAKGGVGKDARRAKKLRDQATEEAKAGNLDKAAALRDRANKIAEKIGPLQDEEKGQNPFRDAKDPGRLARSGLINETMQGAVNPMLGIAMQQGRRAQLVDGMRPPAVAMKADFKEALEQARTLINIEASLAGFGKVKP